jgi:hypothetical protein
MGTYVRVGGLMHEFLHLLGICPDSLSHPSLLTVLGGTAGCGIAFREKIKQFLRRFRRKI